MTGEFAIFGSRTYALLFLLLLFSRGMDFLSTWLATPNLVLEGNPIAKRLGWKWGLPINLAMCFGFALWPVPAMVIATTSLLVAARNFQSAWLMRSMGELAYREWHVQRLQETRASLFLFCLFAQTSLYALVGLGIVYFAWDKDLRVFAIGLGVIAYAIAVAFYSTLGVWRLRRADLLLARLKARQSSKPQSREPGGKHPGLIDIYSPEPPSS